MDDDGVRGGVEGSHDDRMYMKRRTRGTRPEAEGKPRCYIAYAFSFVTSSNGITSLRSSGGSWLAFRPYADPFTLSICPISVAGVFDRDTTPVDDVAVATVAICVSTCWFEG